MHEFHAWASLALTTSGDEDYVVLADAVDRFRNVLSVEVFDDAVFMVHSLNGSHVFVAHGYVNRKRSEGARLDQLVDYVANHFLGAWGLVYERDDGDPIKNNIFQVRKIARGNVSREDDSFLSPCMPVIEDAFE